MTARTYAEAGSPNDRDLSGAGSVVRASGLVKHFGKLEAVKGIDLDVRAGEVFGFLGPNGAGKSTTISILCTLLKPSAGDVIVAGLNVIDRPDDVRARIGLVFQDPSLDDQLTARENLQFHGFVYGLPAAVTKARIARVLEMVGLEDRADSRVFTFSGGMKRRLEIARGMMHHPEVLFLDEPTLGLDPQTRNRIWAHLTELRDQEGLTIFMTTHYMDEAEYCDRIAIIDRGEKVAEGTPAELKSMVGGDVVTISVDDPSAHPDDVARILGIEAVAEDGGMRMEVEDAGSFLPRLVRELPWPVTRLSLNRPTLDDVFLKLTGRAIRDDKAGDLEGLRQMRRMWTARR